MDPPAARVGSAAFGAVAGPGMLVTRPVTFSGRYLFVNLDAPDGELRVEVLDREGRVVPGYAADKRCRCAATRRARA